MPLPKLLMPLVDFAYPPRCPACGGAIAGGAPGGDDALCSDCWNTLELPGQPACAACQAPFAADLGGGDALCAPCMVAPPRHDGIAAATLYGPVSRDMILALKHGGRIALAGPLGRTMASRIPEMTADALVVPVPLHRWRLWRRGYNQAVLLGRAIAAARGWAMAPDALLRTARTPPLRDFNPDQRRRLLKGAIIVNPRRAPQLKGRELILVDDVFTSGATSEACVAALKRAGARRVVIACYARVLEQGREANRRNEASKTPETPRLRASA